MIIDIKFKTSGVRIINGTYNYSKKKETVNVICLKKVLDYHVETKTL